MLGVSRLEARLDQWDAVGAEDTFSKKVHDARCQYILADVNGTGMIVGHQCHWATARLTEVVVDATPAVADHAEATQRASNERPEEERFRLFSRRTLGTIRVAGALHEADTATVVRVSGGDVLTTDGPFAESKEHLGGFYVIEAPDLDAALAWASKTAAAVNHPIEVRPFRHVSEA